MGTGCMRFFLVRWLWQHAHLRWSGVDRTYRFAADWRKMRNGGEYTVPFPTSPQYQAMYYPVYTARGTVVGSFTAATILGWQVKLVGSSRARRLFSPGTDEAPRRSECQCFVRWSFQTLLDIDKDEAASWIETMSPHGWRAGIAGDLHRAGVHPKLIMRIGRWRSRRAMEQYVRDGLAQRLERPSFKAITTVALKRAPYGSTSHCSRDRMFCAGLSSSSGDSSE